MSRREQIRMSGAEVTDFLRSRHTGTLATIGPDGIPHQANLGYLVDDEGAVAMTSFAKAQKVSNLRRNPRASFLVELTGEYSEIRGVLLRGEVELAEEPAVVRPIFFGVREAAAARAGGEHQLVQTDMELHAPKRVALVFRARKIVSWDHRKLGGVY